MTHNITQSDNAIEPGTEHHEFTWNSGHLSIRIGITFRPKYIYIYDHLGIHSLEPKRAKLPITCTGYLSQFVEIGEIEANGGPVEVVRRMLDEAASSREWQQHVATSRQGCLF